MTDLFNELKQLRKREQEILDAVKSEAVQEAEAAVSKLNSLGFTFKLVEQAVSAAKGARTGTRQVKEGPCPICKFQTEPLHDGRRHRSQGDKKKPFTDGELKELGYSRV